VRSADTHTHIHTHVLRGRPCEDGPQACAAKALGEAGWSRAQPFPEGPARPHHPRLCFMLYALCFLSFPSRRAPHALTRTRAQPGPRLRQGRPSPALRPRPDYGRAAPAQS
jgi:hypothetical protein